MESIHFQSLMTLTDFLGRVFGPDYEIALYKIDDGAASLVAIANNHISYKEPGATLSDEALELLPALSSLAVPYRINYRTTSPDYKVLRTSSLLIKDADGNDAALLCISFDNSRFKDISEKILGLCHPDAFVETNFLVDTLTTSVKTLSLPDIQSSGSTSSVSNLIKDEIAKQNLSGKKLTQSERLSVIEALSKRKLFLIKGAVPEVATLLGCSAASIYRYLSKLKK